MTIAKRKEYRNYLLIALFLLIVVRLWMNSFKKKQKEQGKESTGVWNGVESIATIITGVLVVWLLITIAPMFLLAPWLLYAAAIAVALYTLYYGFMRWGSSQSMLPDDFHENLNSNTSIFTEKRDHAPAWMVPVVANDRYINYN